MRELTDHLRSGTNANDRDIGHEGMLSFEALLVLSDLDIKRPCYLIPCERRLQSLHKHFDASPSHTYVCKYGYPQAYLYGAFRSDILRYDSSDVVALSHQTT